jgi:hypothetical protein
MEVSTTKIYLDISILAKSIMDRREYLILIFSSLLSAPLARPRLSHLSTSRPIAASFLSRGRPPLSSDSSSLFPPPPCSPPPLFRSHALFPARARKLEVKCRIFLRRWSDAGRGGAGSACTGNMLLSEQEVDLRAPASCCWARMRLDLERRQSSGKTTPSHAGGGSPAAAGEDALEEN